MKVNDTTIKKRVITCQLNHDELCSLITNKVAELANFKIDAVKTECRVIFKQKEKAGTAGYETVAEVNLVTPLDELNNGN